MTREEFKRELQRIVKKSCVHVFAPFPLVFDKDQYGIVYVDEHNVFNFCDTHYEWLSSNLTLEDVACIRYQTFYENGDIEGNEEDAFKTYIYILFESQEVHFMKLTYYHKGSKRIQVGLEVQKNSDMEELLRCCISKDLYFYSPYTEQDMYEDLKIALEEEGFLEF